MKRWIKNIFIGFLALGFLVSPLIGYSMNKKKSAKAEELTEDTVTLDDTPIKELVFDIEDKKKKESEDKWKKDRQKEAQKKFDAYLNHVPFGDEIQINLNDEADKIGVSIVSAQKLSSDHPLYQKLTSSISDASEFIEVTYKVDVKRGSVDYNGLIFKYFDEKDEAGAILVDDTDETLHLETYKEAENQVIVAFKNESSHLSAKIGNATFKGKVDR